MEEKGASCAGYHLPNNRRCVVTIRQTLRTTQIVFKTSMEHNSQTNGTTAFRQRTAQRKWPILVRNLQRASRKPKEIADNLLLIYI